MPIQRLLAIMARLRDPDGGCPWDLEQSFETIAPHTIEEAYEVDEAIRRGDMVELCDELGDLLLQVVFHARMAEEAGSFAFDDVVNAISEKLVRRHPHVFGEAEVRDAAEVVANWEAIKVRERKAKGAAPDPLGEVPPALPALARAAKLQRRAERAGYEAGSLPTGEEPADEEALGDRLFQVVRLARAAGLDPEKALREANSRFERRVRAARRGS
ncbi:MAG: nucleoside triphosphate pyrophosphohydrolase [Deltaproteobacteria bacterium]|jgi:tetrapyrrole methylase family protein/MazG family protein/ATP diphosphatase|nr:nucleoside triphosphate pyrophosphohydrolase [Deltaproteobacteria bacterium]